MRVKYIMLFIYLFCFFFFFSQAAPVAHRSSQAKGQIGATATPDPSHACDLPHSS